MKNLIKDEKEFEKLTKRDLLYHIEDQINELKNISIRNTLSRTNFELASWAYQQAYEVGYQKALRQLEEFIHYDR